MMLQNKEAKVTETGKKRLSQIYVVAAQFFCNKGFDATSMSDIAGAVGMTKAGIYHFIPGGKKDLLFAVMSYGMDRLDNEVIAPALAIADAERRLRSIIINHAKIITGNSGPNGQNQVTIVVDEMTGMTSVHVRKY